MSLHLRSLIGKDAASDPDNPGKTGPSTPRGSQQPSHPDVPGIDDHVGWNAPRTPPGVATLDEDKIATQAALDTISAKVDHLGTAVEVFAEYMRQQRDREQPTFTAHTITTTPQKFVSQGRPYNALIVGGTAGGTLTVLIPGQDSYTKTLAVGWNVLNIPDSTMLSVDAPHSPLNVQVVRSYTFLGNPL